MLLFLPTDTFLFRWGFFSTLSRRRQRRRRQEEEADGEGHLNKPSVEPGQSGPARFMTLHPSFPTQRPLSGASGCIGPCLLLFVTSVYLSSLSLSCPTFPFLFFMSIYLLPSSISLSGISFSLYPPPLLPDILASCSSRQGVYSCLCKAELQFKR